MNWEEEGGPAEARPRGANGEGVERQLERLSKERMVLTEAWEQLNSRLQIALGPQRPQKGDAMAEPVVERSELSSRLHDESWQLSRLAFGIRETIERLEL